MNLHRILTSALVIGSAIAPAAAQSLTPQPPVLTIEYTLEGESGTVAGIVTAPTQTTDGADLAAADLMTITVSRSNWSAGSATVTVIEGVAPGESKTFTDTAEPMWQLGTQYTYTAVATIGTSTSSPGFASLTPGVAFTFANGAVTATSRAVDASYVVDLSATVPTQTSSYPVEPISFDMTALEFHRVTDRSGWPYETELIGSIPNPVKGEKYTFVDESPEINATNYYMVKCLSPYGRCESQVQVSVGSDIPRGPYPVAAEPVQGGVRVYWTAPTEGMNYGTFDPAGVYYMVYRCWGSADSERELIADHVTATEYTDYGTDLETPLAVRYEVVAANEAGIGGSNYSSYNYDMIIGPADRLPFIETFDGGTDHIWSFAGTSYYCSLNVAETAEYGPDDKEVSPHSGTGLAYVNYQYAWGGAASNDMTSYEIDIENAGRLGASFWYYAIPDNDVSIELQLSRDGGEYETVKSIAVADGVTNPEWRQVLVPLEDTAGVKTLRLRFHTAFSEVKGAAILDDIRLVDYPAVGTIDVAYDSDNCTATLSWQDPSTEYAVATGYEGIVNGESVGEVEMPWVFAAPEYKTNYTLQVKTIYEGIVSEASPQVTVSVPRPPFTEFTVDQHVFSIVQGLEAGDNQIVIKRYIGSDGLYKAPECVTYDDVTYTVVGIGANAYACNESIVSVTLPATITTIGDEAFSGCSSLMAIGFPEGLTEIGQRSFQHCVALRNVSLPAGVAVAAESSFEGCMALETLSLGEGLTSIESRAFADCSSLSKVTFTALTLPIVAEDAFTGIADDCAGVCPEEMTDGYASIPGLAPIHFPTVGISAIMRDAAEVEFFDLHGVPVSKPAPGCAVIARITSADGSIRTIKIIM